MNISIISKSGCCIGILESVKDALRNISDFQNSVQNQVQFSKVRILLFCAAVFVVFAVSAVFIKFHV